MDKIVELDRTRMSKLDDFLKKRTNESVKISESEMDEFHNVLSEYSSKYVNYTRLCNELETCQSELKIIENKSKEMYESLSNKLKEEIAREKWDECGISISILDVI